MVGDTRGSTDQPAWPDPAQLMQRVADQAVAGIPGAVGAAIGLGGRPGTVRYVCTSGYLTGAQGIEVSAEEGLVGAAMRAGRVLSCEDAAADDRADAALCLRFRVRSVLCMPLMRAHRTIGVLNVCSDQPGAFTEEDGAMLRGLAGFVSTVVGAASDLEQVTAALFAPLADADADLQEREGRFVSGVLSPFVTRQLDSRRRIIRMLGRKEPSIVFQPVFDLASGLAVGYEALARFADAPPDTPDRWFDEAHGVGLGVALELAAVRAALSQLDHLPRGMALGINVGPLAVTTPALVDLLQTVNCRRVVLELTEHVAVTDYDALVASVGAIRRTGARLAIDDTGAGVSSLAHVLKLEPDFIKLDRSLIEGIHDDPARQALTRALVSFAQDTGTHLVAEGVEQQSELDVLRRIGVPFAQGFHLGRPTPRMPAGLTEHSR